MPELSDDVAARVADLWHFYDEHAAQARQHESLRATVTGTLAAMAAAVTALAGVGGLSPADVPAGLVIVIVGGLGFALSLKHFERNRFHAAVMFQVQSEIERLRATVLHDPAGATQLWEAAKNTHDQDFSIWKKSPSQKLGRSPWVRVRLYLLWAGLPLGIGLIGVLVVVLGLVGVSVGK